MSEKGSIDEFFRHAIALVKKCDVFISIFEKMCGEYDGQILDAWKARAASISGSLLILLLHLLYLMVLYNLYLETSLEVTLAKLGGYFIFVVASILFMLGFVLPVVFTRIDRCACRNFLLSGCRPHLYLVLLLHAVPRLYEVV